MSEHSAAPQVSEPAPASAGRFAFVSRLLQRLQRPKPAAPESADACEPATEAAPASGRFAVLSRLFARLRKSGVADSAAAPADAPAENTDAAADAGPGRLGRLFDSPLKIVLAAATALLLLLLIALVVVLLAKKKPRLHPAAAATPAVHAPAREHQDRAGAPKPPAGHPAVVPHGAAAPLAQEHGAAPKSDPLAAERARLEQMKAELDKQRQQLEQERKAFAEQAGHAANGSVIGRAGSAGAADVAGSCDLSGDKQSLRENLRRCLGLPEKKAEQGAAKDAAEAAEKPAAAPAHKAAGAH